MDPFLPRTFITPGRLTDSFNVFKTVFLNAHASPEWISTGRGPGRDTGKGNWQDGPHRLGGVTRG